MCGLSTQHLRPSIDASPCGESRQCGGAGPNFCFLDMSQLAFFIGWKPLRNSFGAAAMWFAAAPETPSWRLFKLLNDGKLAVGNYMWVVSLN